MSKNNDNEQLVLVINSGSSSIKYKVFAFPSERVVLDGEVSGIGTAQSRHSVSLKALSQQDVIIKDDLCLLQTHVDGFTAIIKTLSRFDDTLPISLIGHRVVHGGDEFIAPTLIDEAVMAAIERLNPLAPLHNPNNLLGIKICSNIFSAIPQVAVFDTAYHQTMAEHVYRYAIPQAWYQQHKIRRYGFHGTSHQYVAQQAAQLLKRPLKELNLISLHLGNGASVCAIEHGKSIDISMGFTPLEGLIMGSRSGDIDASIALYIQKACGLSSDEVEYALNFESGLKALAGTNELSRLIELEASGDHAAKLALAAYVHRIRKYIGAYLVTLGDVDAIIFTAGVGENSADIRERCCKNLAMFGIKLDRKRNNQQIEQSTFIDAESPIRIIVIPTNEELQIAYEARNTVLVAE
ncbi:MAG: acetate kinase [Methylophaga sp.]|nr:MAG: acetate kinase [Methylophaga sp.]